MRLKDIGMLLANNVRSTAYLQALVNNNLFPSFIILLKNEEKASIGDTLPYFVQSTEVKAKYFDPTKKIKDLAEFYNIKYKILNVEDINSDELIGELKKSKVKYYVYSGPGGQILKNNILSIGKEFLHVHPGKVPSYRGSTTIYYSIIDKDMCYASAFFLRKNIDAGPFIKEKEFPKPEDGKIIDFIYDPYIRSSLLIDVINEYIENDYKFPMKQQPNHNEGNYYIIHPVLKHISILSCN